MPPRWTNRKQFEFLSSLKPTYFEHQANGTVGDFWPIVYHKWDIVFPGTLDGEGDVRKQISNWYPNNTRLDKGANSNALSAVGAIPRKNAKVIPGLLEKRTRKRTRVQIYQALYYSKKWVERCDEEYKKYKTVCEHDGIEPKIMLTFVNDLCAGFLADETDEIKEQVDALLERQEKGEELSLNDVDDELMDGAAELSEEMLAQRKKLIVWNENLQLLPNTLIRTLQGIREKTGFVATICVGGPNPSADGKIYELIVDSEVGQGQPSFKVAYPGFSDLSKGWSDFLHQTFPAEERARRSLQQFQKPEAPAETSTVPIAAPPSTVLITAPPSTVPITAPPSIDTALMTFGDGHDINAHTDPGPVPSAPKTTTTKPTVTSASAPKALTYEQQRKINIARNNRMLARLGNQAFVNRLKRMSKELGKTEVECFMIMEEEEAAAAKAPKPKPKPKPKQVEGSTALPPMTEKGREILGPVSAPAEDQEGPSTTTLPPSSTPIPPASSATSLPLPLPPSPTPTAPPSVNSSSSVLNPDTQPAIAMAGSIPEMPEQCQRPTSASAEVGLSAKSLTMENESEHDELVAIPPVDTSSEPRSVTPDHTGSPTEGERTVGEVVTREQNTAIAASLSSSPTQTDQPITEHQVPSQAAAHPTSQAPTPAPNDTPPQTPRLPAPFVPPPHASAPPVPPTPTPTVHSSPLRPSRPPPPAIEPKLSPPVVQSSSELETSAITAKITDVPSQIITGTDLERSGMDIDVAESAPSDSETHPVDPEGDPENSSEQEGKKAYVVDAVNFFRKQEVAGEGVQVAMLKKDWEQLVDVWAAFEEAVGYPDAEGKSTRLDPKDRPEQVGWWIKRKREFEREPPIDDLDTYARTFRDWWTRLQPGWRTAAGSWPLSRQTPTDENWSAVAKGGPNGVFIVLMGLAWWFSGVDTEQKQHILASVLEDVLWTIQTMLEGIKEGKPVAGIIEAKRLSGVKRASAGNLPASKKMRT